MGGLPGHTPWIHYSFAQHQRQGACKWRFAGANDPRRPASSASAVFCANDGRSVLRPPLHPPGVAGSLETQVAVVVVRGGGGARHARSASGPATTGRGEGGSVGWACGRPAVMGAWPDPFTTNAPHMLGLGLHRLRAALMPMGTPRFCLGHFFLHESLRLAALSYLNMQGRASHYLLRVSTEALCHSG